MRNLLCTGAALLLALAPTWAAADTLPEGASKATLVNATPTPVEAIIDGRIWRCAGQDCAAEASDSADSQTPIHECHRTAIWLGQFTAYQTGSKVMNPTELAECNARVTTKTPRSPG